MSPQGGIGVGILLLILWGSGFLSGFALARGPAEWRKAIATWRKFKWGEAP